MIRDDLENDPERLASECLPLLRYSEAKRVFDRGSAGELKAWAGSEFMALVEENAFADAAAELEQAKATETPAED